MTDPWETDPEFLAWKANVQENLIPMLRDSSISVTLFNDDPDAKLAVELGLSLLLGKPVVLVVRRGEVVPAGLARAADEVVYVDWADMDAAQRTVRRAIKRTMDRLDAAGSPE